MGMSIDECVKMLIAKEKCIERETSGTDTDCNYHNCDECSLCYEQGNMGEQKEALRFAVNIMRNYQMMQADYNVRLKADTTEKVKEFRDKLSKWMFHNRESVCGNSMIDIDYLEGHMDELLYELGIYEVGDGNDN